MSVTLLVVDHSASTAEQIAQILRDADYAVQEALWSTQASDIYHHLTYKPITLILIRLDAGLPSIAVVREHLAATHQTPPLLAILDDCFGPQAAAALQAGADNFCALQAPRHLLAVVHKELHQAQIRQQVRSLNTRLLEAETRYKELLEHERDAIAFVCEGVHRYVNPAYQQRFGYASQDEMQGLPLLALIHRDDHDQIQQLLRRLSHAKNGAASVNVRAITRTGEEFLCQMECTPTHTDDAPGWQIRVADRASQTGNHDQPTHERLAAFSKYDPVTGLYNRKFFTDYLEALRVQRSSGAVLYILLNDYRAINEQLGLEAFDQLVSELAESIKSLAVEPTHIARFADAVFTLYTPEVAREHLLRLGETICAAIKAHTSHADNRLLTTSACIGICLLRASHTGATQILIEADRACKSARQRGDSRVHIYSPTTGLSGLSAEAEQLLVTLKDAIAEQRLALYFQPIASFYGATTERYQVFLRILDEHNQPLAMDKVIPLLESRNLMQPLDKWVIARALKRSAERQRGNQTATVLFIAVSANSLVDEGFCPWLERRLSDIGLPGDTLVLEVTEETAEHHFPQMQAFQQQLQALQCGLALSHIGGNPHSQQLLRHLQPDYIKLDGALIEQLTKGKDHHRRATVTQLTGQACTKRTQIIAANVANAAQMAGIWQFGVTLVQGDMVQEAGSQMTFDFQQFSG